MTLVEFLHPLQGKPTRDLCLAALYYEHRYAHKDSLTVEEIRAALKRAHIPRSAKLNIADILAKGAPFVEVSGKKGKAFLWLLTASGQVRVRSLLGLPDTSAEIEHDVSALDSIAGSVSDPSVAAYIREALKCLSVGALRATVVFLWAGAARKIQQDMAGKGSANVFAAIQKHDSKARHFGGVDDFSYVKESVQLLAAQSLGLLDKNQRSILEDALDLRNKCAHPGKYSPGVKKVSAFVEDVVNVVFT